ncbi:MAG TPA: 23S rRNA (pseudouridine(1915)-N(3))-methyltransferase RlmH [Bacilli bacterium]|nr:23S rRNA (pseudouridine(1915)-N(3))-methyltransferase RlmH [Bacilli bacterium]
MTINIISVGKIKESGLKSLIFEYEKRISKFAKINIVELKDLASENASSEADKLIVLEEEGQNILSKILDRDYVIALAIEGNKYSSERFAELIEKGFVQGGAKLTFIIGGSLGLSQRVKLRANSLISFSEMTFPHQLMKVILLEQTYRAFKILNNEPYHK